MQNLDHNVKKILLTHNFLGQDFVTKQLHTDMHHAIWQLVDAVRVAVYHQYFGYLLIVLAEYSGKCFLQYEISYLLVKYLKTREC